MVKFYAREYKLGANQGWAYAPLVGITTREEAIKVAKFWGPRCAHQLHEVRVWDDGTIEARAWTGLVHNNWNSTYPAAYNLDEQREQERIIQEVFGD